MKSFSRNVLVGSIAALVLWGGFARAYQSPGQPTGFVNDYAALLTTEQKSSLEQKLQSYEQQSGNEIAVVTIQNLDGDTIENYANSLFREWGIGKADTDNGILVLVSKDDREIRIEIGYGLEGNLTDTQAFWIIDQKMKPAFRNDDYAGGINAAVDKLIGTLTGTDVVPNETPASSGAENWLAGMLPFIFFFGLIFLRILSTILGRTKSWWQGGVLGAIAGIIILAFAGWIIGLVAIFVLTMFGFIFDLVVSNTYRAVKKKHPLYPWWMSGFGGGGFGSGGGFGGGSSGGGGASGGW